MPTGTVFSDTMAGSAGALLSSRAPNVGAYSAGAADWQLTSAGRARPNIAIFGSTILSSASVGDDANYDASLDVRIADTTGWSTGLWCRYVNNADQVRYEANLYYNGSTLQVTLQKCVTGGGSIPAPLTTYTLGSGGYSMSVSAGQTVSVQLSCQGTAIKVYVDGTLRISATDSSITAKGSLAVYHIAYGTPSDTVGAQIDNLLVTGTITAVPAQISGSSSASASASLTLANSNPRAVPLSASAATASASLSLATGGPVTVTPGASNSTATGSLSLAANKPLGSLASTATADGTLALATTSAVGSRAAPGWLGMFVLDSSGSSVPLIAGGASATATASLSLLTPSPRTISGTSLARAIGSMFLTLASGGPARIVRDTYVTSAQFGAKTVSSDTFGERTVEVHPESTIS